MFTAQRIQNIHYVVEDFNVINARIFDKIASTRLYNTQHKIVLKYQFNMLHNQTSPSCNAISALLC